MTALERWALGALLWAATCSACHATSRLPLTLRPDTRPIEFVRFDSTTMTQTMMILQAALPNETAVCYFGGLYDSTVVREDGAHRAKVLHLVLAQEAVADSTDEYHVYYSKPWAGCPSTVVAIGHSHPYAGAGLCTHSAPDANVLFLSPRVLVSIVWCGDGRLEMLYQDGRRYENRWRASQ
ncbi:MAG TPA: hypothetical protein VLA89_07820 [Gemmatimonadales bacterium]|nr:hypothetical protein [Gemmatimonadales bacterium]